MGTLLGGLVIISHVAFQTAGAAETNDASFPSPAVSNFCRVLFLTFTAENMS